MGEILWKDGNNYLVTRSFGQRKAVKRLSGSFKGIRARVAVKRVEKVCAEGNGRFTGADQSKFYETAYKATILSASLLDLVCGGGPDERTRVEESRELLRRIAAMLTALSKVATHG